MLHSEFMNLSRLGEYFHPIREAGGDKGIDLEHCIIEAVELVIRTMITVTSTIDPVIIKTFSVISDSFLSSQFMQLTLHLSYYCNNPHNPMYCRVELRLIESCP